MIPFPGQTMKSKNDSNGGKGKCILFLRSLGKTSSYNKTKNDFFVSRGDVLAEKITQVEQFLLRDNLFEESSQGERLFLR